MNVFSRYAEYYDLIYADKDYSTEADFVLGKLGATENSGKTILELGCGTGRHAVEFLRRALLVSGIDLSPDMVDLARSRLAKEGAKVASELISVGDIRDVRIQKQFDYVVSLFHVFCYQSSDADLKAAFETAAIHLAQGGKLFIDFWYGPAVLADPPHRRKVTFRGADFSVDRSADPEMLATGNLVDVNYALRFKPDDSEETTDIHETHRMRYFFLPELERHLDNVDMKLCRSGRWLSDQPLGDTSWYGWITAEHR